ncbi:MAG: restriction endonuclease subunit S [Rhodocyclaceae bacterium]|nr:restriction endonuclease subunit S [Rhodocyclaceae bacterium]
MKVGWQQTTLGSIAQVGSGNSAPQGDALFADGIHPFFRTSDAGRIRFGDIVESTDYLNDEGAKGLRRFPAGTILFPKSGASTFLNHRVMMGVDGYVSSHLATIVGDESKIDRRYLLYFLSTVSAQDLVQDHTYPSLNLPLIAGIPVALPSLPEQHRIVAILDAAFDGIATAKANAEQNLQNARASFESHLQQVFTERGKGWVEKRLGEVCTITSNLVDPRKEEFRDLIHVGAANIEPQTGVFVGLKTARDEGLISGKFLFDESMVLYSKIRPYLMKVARPGFSGLCSADMYPLAPLPNQITRDYLFHLLLSKPFTDYAIQGSARAGMPKVNREHLFDFRVWLPDVEKQSELSLKLDALHAETQHLESLYRQKLTALGDLKRSLLHQAFSGQL